MYKEVKLRRYSYQTGKSYIFIVKGFLASGKTPREFLLLDTTIRYNKIYNKKQIDNEVVSFFLMAFFWAVLCFLDEAH